MKLKLISPPTASLLAVATFVAATPLAGAQTQAPVAGPDPAPSLLHCAAHPAPTVTPREYTRLHSMLLSSDGQATLIDFTDPSGFKVEKDLEPPSIPEAIDRLGVIGDEFTLSLVPKFAERHPDHQAALTNAAQRIRTRLAERIDAAETTDAAIRDRLERAAYADITCANIESLIVPWTLNRLGARMQEKEVAAAVARLGQAELPVDPSNPGGNFLAKRVQNYAQRLMTNSKAHTNSDPQ